MTDLKEPIYGYQWRCVPGCDFANHELRQRCRNCGTPRSLAAFIDYYRPAVFFVTDLLHALKVQEAAEAYDDMVAVGGDFE